MSAGARTGLPQTFFQTRVGSGRTSLECAGAQPIQQTGCGQGAVGEQWADQPVVRRQGLSGRVQTPAVADPATRYYCQPRSATPQATTSGARQTQVRDRD